MLPDPGNKPVSRRSAILTAQEPEEVFSVSLWCSSWPRQRKERQGALAMGVEAVLGITLGVTAVTLLGACYAACHSVDSELREESRLFRMRERRGLWLGK